MVRRRDRLARSRSRQRMVQSGPRMTNRERLGMTRTMLQEATRLDALDDDNEALRMVNVNLRRILAHNGLYTDLQWRMVANERGFPMDQADGARGSGEGGSLRGPS